MTKALPTIHAKVLNDLLNFKLDNFQKIDNIRKNLFCYKRCGPTRKR